MRMFDFAIDPTGELGNTLVPQMRGGQVTVSSDEVHVQLGEPPAFEMLIPRTAIAQIDRAPDLTRATRGIHGSRGRWLVNRAGTGMVRLSFTQRLPARLTTKVGSVRALESAGRFANAVARLVLRERTLKVRELTLSLDDPEGFVTSLAP